MITLKIANFIASNIFKLLPLYNACSPNSILASLRFFLAHARDADGLTREFSFEHFNTHEMPLRGTR